MIDEIVVRDVALIREARMVPARGLTALTGETGAGKTALLSACKLLVGERADKSAVREGTDGAQVQARFFRDLAHARGNSAAAGEGDAADAVALGASDGSLSVAADAEYELETGDAGEELVVSRRVGADGRSRATLNGQMASVGELAARVSPLLDLCGQHEHQRLMKASSHRAMLDAWAHDAVEGPRAAYAAAFEDARAAAAELSRVLEAGEASSAKLDEARFTLQRIDAVGLHDGEYDELSVYLSKAEHAEALAVATNAAHEALSGESGAIDALSAAASALESVAAYDEELGACATSLREASYVLEDVSRDALSYRDGIDYDAQQLAQAQERMAALQGLMRTYGPRLEDVAARRDEAAELVSLVDDAELRERAARAALEEAEGRLALAADALDEARGVAAPQFAQAVTATMARLEMGSAELECVQTRLERSQWTKGGPSAVEFLFRPGAGMQARPLARIASGGEMSRVLLAVKVALGDADEVETLVFDEVDAGVGGATAVALADVLSDVARTHQVIVVTHLAQVAAAAERQYRVSKSEGPVPETTLELVEGDERVAEVARMLSGTATEASLAHAAELLER